MNKEKLFYTIGEVAEELHLEQHVLRFWESQFHQIQPLKRKSRRLYNQECIEKIKEVKHMLYDKKYKIEGAQMELSKKGVQLNNDTNINVNKEYIKDLLQEMTDLRDYLTSKINNKENN